MNTLTLILGAAAVLLLAAAVFFALQATKAKAQASAGTDARIHAEAEAKIIRDQATRSAESEIKGAKDRAQREADAILKEAELKAKEQALAARQEAEKTLYERQGALDKQEQRIQSKEENLDKKTLALDEKSKGIEQKTKELETATEKRKAELEKLQAQQAEAKALVEAQAKKLEEVAGLTREDAKKEIIESLEYTAKMDAAKLIRRIEEEAQEEGMKKARWTIGAAIQRVASDVVSESAVSSVQLPSDDLKGRIIGREGRNIRAIEKATGCDLIVDDTPETIVVSSFDPIRREVARQAILKRLCRRPDPSGPHRGSRREGQAGMRSALEGSRRGGGHRAGFPGHPPGAASSLLGGSATAPATARTCCSTARRWPFSPTTMAGELGTMHVCPSAPGFCTTSARRSTARWTAPTSRSESSCCASTARAERSSTPWPATTATTIHSPSRRSWSPRRTRSRPRDRAPGAKCSSRTCKRLEKLEGIANGFKGVQKSFAIQAGREIRIIVDSGRVSDEEALWLSKDIARKIEQELTYPGQIRVTVIRETRATEFAR